MRDIWLAMLVVLETILLFAIVALFLWVASVAIVAGGEPLSSWTGGLAESLAGFGLIELALAVAALAVLYWVLQIVGRDRLAFWLITSLALFSQFPGIWTHNLLEWQRFFGLSLTFNVDQSLHIVSAQFLASLAGLVCLRRVSNLRRLGSLISSLNIDVSERNQVILNEGVVLAGTIVAGLVVAAAAVAANAVLGRTETLMDRIPLAVITLGGGATLLLICFIALFRRSLDTR